MRTTRSVGTRRRDRRRQQPPTGEQPARTPDTPSPDISQPAGGTDWAAVAGTDATLAALPRRWTGLPLAVAAAVGTAVLAPAAPAQADAATPADTAPAARASRSGVAAPVVTRSHAAPLPVTARRAGVVYTVRPGDTLSHIALRTRTTVAALIAANGLDARGSIRAGQTITLPTPGGAVAQPRRGAEEAGARRYTVRAGDTVGQIALRAGTTTAAVVAANGLDARATIRVGQVLQLPGGRSGTQPGGQSAGTNGARSGGSYTVRPGDTLSQVATREGTTLAALRAANPGLDARSTIHVGQVLRLPDGAARVPSSFAGRTYPEDTVRAAQANSDALAARAVPSRATMQRIVADTARARGVDPALAQAVAYQESGFNMRAVSPANAVGAMQVIPSSGRWASDLAGRRLDLLDPHDNALAGVLILRALLRAEPDRATAVAGYYQGLASVRRNGMYPDTRRYVATVQTLTERFR